MFKLTILIAVLAYARAGYIGTEHAYASPVATPAHYSPSAPAVSYSSFVRYFPSQAALQFTHEQAHPAPIVPTASHAYAAAPLINQQRVIYGQNHAPALAYGQGYAPALPQDNYGGPTYETRPLVVAQPQPHQYHHNTYATHAAPVVAAHDYQQGEQFVYDQHHGQY